MKPTNCTHFHDSFRTVASDIAKVISARQAATSNGHYVKRTEFCIDVDLEPLHML